MRSFLGLTGRGCLVYVKDKSTVFFSMLTPILLFLLYFLFLKRTFLAGIEDVTRGLEEFLTTEDVSLIADAVFLSGILGCALLTISYNVLSLMVADRERKVVMDVLATPVGRGTVILSYLTSAALCTFLMTCAIAAIGMGILMAGGASYTPADFLRMAGLLLLGSVSSASVLCIFLMFFRSMSASGAFMGLLSAVSGFVIGAYIPLSSFSDMVHSVCNLVPATEVTVLIRNLLVSAPLRAAADKLPEMGRGLFENGIRDGFCLHASWMGEEISAAGSASYVMIVLAVTIPVLAALYRKNYKLG